MATMKIAASKSQNRKRKLDLQPTIDFDNIPSNEDLPKYELIARIRSIASISATHFQKYSQAEKDSKLLKHQMIAGIKQTRIRLHQLISQHRDRLTNSNDLSNFEENLIHWEKSLEFFLAQDVEDEDFQRMRKDSLNIADTLESINRYLP